VFRAKRIAVHARSRVLQLTTATEGCQAHFGEPPWLKSTNKRQTPAR